MTAANHDITIEQGATFNLTFYYAEALEAVESITRSSSTATVSMEGHGFNTDDYVLIVGAEQPEYNGVFQVTRVDDDEFTYSVSNAPKTPATGNLRAAASQDLTDYTATMIIASGFNSDDKIVEWTSDDGDITITSSEGKVEVSIPASETKDLTFDKALYDLEIEDLNGNIYKLLRGNVSLKREVGR